MGAIGFSRLYLGAPYRSDVLAGFSLGLGWTTLCVLLIGLARIHSGGGGQAEAAGRPSSTYAGGHPHSRMCRPSPP
jgi:membrane-associated phospholipid phosphatase